MNQILLDVLCICLLLHAVHEDSIENSSDEAPLSPHPPPVLNICPRGRQNDPYYYADDRQNIYY